MECMAAAGGQSPERKSGMFFLLLSAAPLSEYLFMPSLTLATNLLYLSAHMLECDNYWSPNSHIPSFRHAERDQFCFLCFRLIIGGKDS